MEPRIGRNEGATLACGGERVGNRGYFIRPAVFADVHDDMKIGREEIFGPVMSVMAFNDMDEVIARANKTDYGLAAASGSATSRRRTLQPMVYGPVRSGSTATTFSAPEPLRRLQAIRDGTRTGRVRFARIHRNKNRHP